MKSSTTVLVGLLLWTVSVTASQADPARTTAQSGALDPATTVTAALPDENLRRLVTEVLERNPDVAFARAQTMAAEQQAPQVRALPDPTASLTLFVMQPQTRVGPQQATVNLAQRVPWFGTLDLKEQAALLDAAASRMQWQAKRLEVVTRARNLYLELQYLDREQLLVQQERSMLEHYEELAQARYASGIGISQTVIKIQAEITRLQSRVIEIERRRQTTLAALNSLRDRPDNSSIAISVSTPSSAPFFPIASLRRHALLLRPELGEAEARISSAATRIEIANKSAKPDLVFGLTYGFVGRRDDDAGRMNPPQGNGDDSLGLTGGLSLPVWAAKNDAVIEQAAQQSLAAEQARRATAARINGEINDLAGRLPLLHEQLQLFDSTLVVQAEESLRSAEEAYAAGTAMALDLLDAERTLFAVRLGAERLKTDIAVTLARLEGAVGAPLATLNESGGGS